MSLTQIALIASLTLALSLGLTGAARWLGLRFHIIDLPNERSSHVVPNSRIGGVGIVIAFFTGLLLIFIYGQGVEPGVKRRLIGLALGAGMLSLVSLADDIYSASSRYRYGVSVVFKYAAQVLAALVAVYFGNKITSLSLLTWTIELRWLGVLFSVIWITWMANAFNFMDGIDGLAGGTAAIYALFSSMIAFLIGQETVAFVCIILLTSCLGFLPHNFPRATVFMGDVGAIFLGYVLGTISLMLSAGTPHHAPFTSLVLIFAAFNYDAVYTLFRRIKRERRILGPHRTHLYQRLIIQGLNHKQVTLIYYFISLVLGGLALWHLQTSNLTRIGILITVLLILLAGTLGVAAYERHLNRT